MFLLISGAILGLVLGSFVGMASWRWPKEKSWLTPSSCFSCGNKLKAFDLVPVFTWVMRKGRCGCGQQKVPVRYTLIEITLALLMAVALWKTGFSPAFVALAVLLTALVLLSAIDFETGFIPDGANLTVAVSGLAFILLTGAPLLEHAASALVLGGIGVFMATLYSRWRKRDMLGWGDVKLMFVAGFWVPLEAAPLYLAASGGLGIALGLLMTGRDVRREFPFGPALALALAGFALHSTNLRASFTLAP